MRSYALLISIVYFAWNGIVDGKSFGEEDIRDDIKALENEVERLANSVHNLQDNEELSVIDNIAKINEDATAEESSVFDGIANINDATEEFGAVENIEKINKEVDVTGVQEIDIKYPDSTEESGNEKRNAVRNPNSIWRSRDIGYVLDRDLTLAAVKVIPTALEFISNVSCIKFHERRSSDSQWLNFINSTGCWSYVGKVSGRTNQDISIGIRCAYTGVVLHEILHALGFYHEQSRYDRDQYIEIKWENIVQGREWNFRKMSIGRTRNMKTPYDYGSIMHYGKMSFSKNGKNVIEKVRNVGARIGQRRTLSEVDVTSLNILYHCYDSNKQNQWTEWSDYGACHMMSDDEIEQCYKTRYRFCAGENCACTARLDCTVDKKACTDQECRVDGHWGHWELWSTCDATRPCQQGRKRSKRICDNPLPVKGGAQCNGTSEKQTKCLGPQQCPQQCTFNEDKCGYKFSGAWVLGQGATPSSGTGPSSDVDGDGMYVYTEVSRKPENFTSNLTSPFFKATSGPRCFSLRYHMFGSDIGQLSINLEVDGEFIEILKLDGEQGNEWKLAEFNVDRPQLFRIIFIGIAGKSFRGDIALDNLFLGDEPCVGTPISTPAASTSTESTTTMSSTSTHESTTTMSSTSTQESTTTMVSTSTQESTTTSSKSTRTTRPSPTRPAQSSLPSFNCSFNNAELCRMEIISDYLGVSSTVTLHWHPMKHGQGVDPIEDRVAERGYFLNVYAGSFQDVGKTSIIRTPFFTGAGRQSIEFFYYIWNNDLPVGMKQKHMGSLQVSLVEVGRAGKSCVLFTETGARNAVWEYAWINVRVRFGVKFYLKFAAILGKVNSTIAIDDIRGLASRKSRRTVASPSVLSCSFNSKVNSFCEWKNIGHFKWNTTEGTAGPNYPDAVTGADNDYYAYVKTFSKRAGAYAMMMSPVIVTRTPMCLIFFSNTFGIDIHRCKLKVGVWGSRSPVRKDLIKNSTSGDWKEHRIQLPVNRMSVVTVRAVAGLRPKCVMAIDNVITVPGKCGKHTTERLICDFENIRQCIDSGFSSSNFQVSDSWSSSPNKSYYMSKMNSGVASLKFPIDAYRFGSCLEFQYRVKTDSNVGYMELVFYTATTGKSIVPMKIKAYPKESVWQLYRASIPPRAYTAKLTVKLYVKFGSKFGYLKEVNIDNIRISSGMCKKVVIVKGLKNHGYGYGY